LVDPARTSPIAKMPSRLVSSGRRPGAQHDDHPRARLTRGHDSLAGAVRARRPEAAQTLDLGCLQDREHLIVPRLDRWSLRGRHGRHAILVEPGLAAFAAERQVAYLGWCEVGE
jgi:hypothetical protein